MAHAAQNFGWDDWTHLLALARHGGTSAAGRAPGLDPSTVQRRLATVAAEVAGVLWLTCPAPWPRARRLWRCGPATPMPPNGLGQRRGAFADRAGGAEPDLVQVIGPVAALMRSGPLLTTPELRHTPRGPAAGQQPNPTRGDPGLALRVDGEPAARQVVRRLLQPARCGPDRAAAGHGRDPRAAGGCRAAAADLDA
jgi:hypothetical protein